MFHDPPLAPFLIICAQLQPIFQPWCQPARNLIQPSSHPHHHSDHPEHPHPAILLIFVLIIRQINSTQLPVVCDPPCEHGGVCSSPGGTCTCPPGHRSHYLIPNLLSSFILINCFKRSFFAPSLISLICILIMNEEYNDCTRGPTCAETTCKRLDIFKTFKDISSHIIIIRGTLFTKTFKCNFYDFQGCFVTYYNVYVRHNMCFP